MRIETLLLPERYCPPLTASTLKAAMDDAQAWNPEHGDLTYATSDGDFLTVHAASNGGVELVFWGFNAEDPNSDRLGKFERRSNFGRNEFDKALTWAGDQVSRPLREAGKENIWSRQGLKKPVAINKLRYNEPTDRAKRASKVKLQFTGEMPGTDPIGGLYHSFRFTAGQHERRYAQEVRVYGKKPNGISPTWVSCECGDFRYVWDWALATRRSSALTHAIDQKPIIRNPKLLKATCKHLHAALEWLRWERKI